MNRRGVILVERYFGEDILIKALSNRGGNEEVFGWGGLKNGRRRIIGKGGSDSQLNKGREKRVVSVVCSPRRSRVSREKKEVGMLVPRRIEKNESIYTWQGSLATLSIRKRGKEEKKTLLRGRANMSKRFREDEFRIVKETAKKR